MDVNTLEVTRGRSFMDSMCKGLEMGERVTCLRKKDECG